MVTSPNPSTTSNYLQSITAVSPDDLWAVGFSGSASGDQTLIEHWDGTAWSVIASPNGGSDNYLEEVSARAANDVWAVGYSHSGSVWHGNVFGALDALDSLDNCPRVTRVFGWK